MLISPIWGNTYRFNEFQISCNVWDFSPAAFFSSYQFAGDIFKRIHPDAADFLLAGALLFERVDKLCQ
ncbi:Uncharacterised protein [Salmonella enterica subsp. enterica]|nr:Uncharacterised protein [Salmonella enterica subsp. enterica]